MVNFHPDSSLYARLIRSVCIKDLARLDFVPGNLLPPVLILALWKVASKSSCAWDESVLETRRVGSFVSLRSPLSSTSWRCLRLLLRCCRSSFALSSLDPATSKVEVSVVLAMTSDVTHQSVLRPRKSSRNYPSFFRFSIAFF